MKKEGEDIAPIKKIIKTIPSSLSPAVKESDASLPSFGTYCSRCGNRVPDVSKFCNRCGSLIVVPGNLAESTTPKAAVFQSGDAEQSARAIQLIGKDMRIIEPLIEPSLTHLPSDSQWAVPQQLETSQEKTSGTSFPESISSWSDSIVPATNEKPEQPRPVINDSHYSETMAPSGKPPVPEKPWDGHRFKPGKKAVLGIIVVIIIVAIVLGAFFIYPMISTNEGVSPDDSTALTTIPTITKNSGTAVPTIIKNSGTTVFVTKTLKPTATVTYRPTPGNSGSTVGLEHAWD